ncbi:hypothetical protein [Hydromonas duriensis]|uniref:Uncharacterized protein n=1 Tax=Hydromonas duriensis TaxID=1527608 RepID=A0A4R6Y0E8_9BURK|nr:hypothetical protein [Hydromonas duriensis]TDR27860.1 hypothetical protein DFR44_1363 [Hydromonas duriensis]
MSTLDMAEILTLAQMQVATPVLQKTGGIGGTNNGYSPILKKPSSLVLTGFKWCVSPIPQIPPKKTHTSAHDANVTTTLNTHEPNEVNTKEQLRQLEALIHAVCDTKGLSHTVRQRCLNERHKLPNYNVNDHIAYYTKALERERIHSTFNQPQNPIKR